MRRILALQLLLVGCSSAEEKEPPKARATLQVTFGSNAPIALNADVASNTTTSRWIMQSNDGDTTVFVSIARPLPAQPIPLTSDAQNISVWAKEDSMLPLIATAGTLTVETVESLVNLQFADVSKPADDAGTSLLITGSMTEVMPP